MEDTGQPGPTWAPERCPEGRAVQWPEFGGGAASSLPLKRRCHGNGC